MARSDALTCQCTHEIEEHDVYATGDVSCRRCECVSFEPKKVEDMLRRRGFVKITVDGRSHYVREVRK